MSDVTVFAKIANTAHVAEFDWKNSAVDLPTPTREQMMDMSWEMPVGNPIAAVDFVLPTLPQHANLPTLTQEQAHKVAEACYHSGAYMDVAAIVLVHLGEDAMQEYCEFQSYCGMRKDYLEAKGEDRKWWHSGLTQIIIDQYQPLQVA